ncbi:MAG: hypothetical protein B7Z72_13590 [Gemmatimonadetes bacterium 21-71-4]|nr:MAG: hypothetical protein B7Z72_13590 [Gemmatimonadetes bacterium 21-71-4]
MTEHAGFDARGDAGVGSRPVDRARRDVRERWRMEPEAKALVFITAAVLAFGLAVLYSASAIVAMNENHSSAYFLIRQLEGAAVGVAAFAIAAKMDAQKWERWAWPLMWLTIATMIACLILPASIAPRVHGSKRFLFGTSLQPSELGKFGVIVWVAMLTVKKGEQLRRLTKGVLPILLVIGVLDVLAALEPDLSVAMLYTLLMAVILYAGGVRIGHFVALGIIVTPLLWTEAQKLQYALLRLTSFFDPGSAPATVSYQLQQSLVAVGSGRLFGVGFGEGRQQYGFLPFPYSDFIASNIGEEWGFLGRHRAHGAPARGSGGRAAAHDRPHAAVRLVRPLQSGAHPVHHGRAREHRQHQGARGRGRRHQSPGRLTAMRVIFAGGGTGGHLYPGLAIARALVRERPGVQPFFVGAERGIEREVLPKAEFPYLLLDLHPLHRRSPWKNWRTVVSAVAVWRRIRALVKEERPALVVGTGGYASGLMLEYARRRKIPIVQQVGDSFPGLTARRYSRDCAEIYLTFPEAARFLRARDPRVIVDTGAPIDPPNVERPSRAQAREHWGFPPTGGHVLLIYGGSQGAPISHWPAPAR